MKFNNIAVAGGGVLGSQIALQSSYCGFNVRIWLRSASSIERCNNKLDRYAAIYERTLAASKVSAHARARGLSDRSATADELDKLIEHTANARASITLTTSYEMAFSDADLVIEAIAEDPAQKKAFYQELAGHLPDKTVVATNSSTLLPSLFAKHTGRPDRYLALHFANDIYRNNTAEIMGHPGTDQQCYKQVVEFAKAIHMVPLCLKKEQPGYILNSMLVPFLNAAENLYVNGVADIETIDKTWTLATGAPVGPFRILDAVGIDTAYNIVKMNPQSSDSRTAPGRIAALLKEMIDAGKTGVNAGEGFYRYR